MYVFYEKCFVRNDEMNKLQHPDNELIVQRSARRIFIFYMVNVDPLEIYGFFSIDMTTQWQWSNSDV